MATSWDLARGVVWAQRKKLAMGLVLLFADRLAGFVIPLAPKLLIDEVVAKRRAEVVSERRGPLKARLDAAALGLAYATRAAAKALLRRHARRELRHARAHLKTAVDTRITRR